MYKYTDGPDPGERGRGVGVRGRGARSLARASSGRSSRAPDGVPRAGTSACGRLSEPPGLRRSQVKRHRLAADGRGLRRGLSRASPWRRDRYGSDHGAAPLLQEAVYGLPEANRERVRSARLVANPGCYPTAAALALLPLLASGRVRGPVIVDAKSGVS